MEIKKTGMKYLSQDFAHSKGLTLVIIFINKNWAFHFQYFFFLFSKVFNFFALLPHTLKNCLM